MKTVKTNTVLVNFKGEPLKEKTEDGGEVIRAGIVLANIMGGKVDNVTLGWILGKKFATDKEVDLKAEEVIFVKKEIEKAAVAWLSTTIAGQLIEMLDSKDVPEPSGKGKK